MAFVGFRLEDWLHRILDSYHCVHFVLHYLLMLVMEQIDLLLHLTQAVKLVVAYLALRTWIRNILDSRYLRLNFVKMELQCYKNSLMIAVR